MNTDFAQLQVLLRATRIPPEMMDRLRRRMLPDDPGSTSDLDLGALFRLSGAAQMRLIERHGVRIIRNPSASCSVATSVLKLLIALERQAALQHTSIFPDSEPDAPFSFGILPPLEPNETRDLSKLTPLSRMVNEVLTRCIEDAYDQCVESGSPWPFFELAIALARELALLGLDQSQMLSRVHPRMRDCAVYELEVAADQSARIVYPGPAAYTSQVRDIARRGKLRLVTPEPVDSYSVLAASVLQGQAIQALTLPTLTLPTLTCTGQHGEHCRWKPVIGVPPDAATILLEDFRVKHKFRRARISARPPPDAATGPQDATPESASQRLRYESRPLFIELEDFTPNTMRQDSLALRYNSGPLFIEVLHADGRLLRNDTFILLNSARRGQPIEDWERHDVALESIVFSKKLDETYDGSRQGSVISRTIHETITFKLKHVPENRAQPPDSVPPPLPNRRPAVPARR